MSAEQSSTYSHSTDAVEDMRKHLIQIASSSPELYEGDAGLPIFSHISSQRKCLFTVQDVAVCLLHPCHNKAYLCKKVPTRISSNVAFLMDINVVDDPSDIDSDDMGVWKNNRVDSAYVSITVGPNEVTNVRICNKSMLSERDNVFVVKRVYRIHGTDSSLRKITSTIYDRSSL
jgi:hypothetical protein